MGKKRIAVIDKELCRNVKCGYHCQKACPVNRSGEECIYIEEGGVFPVINEELCIGCLLCIKKCDKMGFHALSVVNLPKELEENPVHRYGRNGFALFRLPIPRKNMVVGLIGPNGVGKTTVLNVLSGDIQPNTGIPGKKFNWDTFIEKFKGTELQRYLETLKEGGITVGYKPQHVDLIPNTWSGNVQKLLEKTSNENKILKLAEKFEITKMLNKNVSDLSGGELQLLAIIAVLSKDSDLYFFDEPSSYLDVKQRLLVARVIRSLSEKSMIMVVEHDLAILDYLSDDVHILYGKPGVFGVVSKPAGVRVGINTYLEGYIKEENVRFREKPITFSNRPQLSVKNQKFLDFTEFSKKFDGFEMRTEAGEIYRSEIIGILGPNSIGKTTFIKMMVGELEPDKGKSLEGLKISYKPQRLVIKKKENEMMVKDYLEKKSGKTCMDSEFKRLLESIGITRNLDKKMKNLSGGELQAVFIATSLGKEHDIILMDEPSAFLDVEQRLSVCKIIRSHIEEHGVSAFVIDHDLQVIDSVSDRIMVFEGKSGSVGLGRTPCEIQEGMNSFLKSLGVTFRRDPSTGRARANKPDSQKDGEQKESGEYYYTKN